MPVTVSTVLQVPALDSCSCNLDERNRLLDVRVIIVIRGISRRDGSKFRPSVYPTQELYAQIILGVTRSDFKRAGIFCVSDRIRTFRSTRRCGLTEGFMCSVFVNFQC